MRGVSAIPVKSISLNISKTFVKAFRLSRGEERSNFCELYNKVDKSFEVQMLCHASNSEVVQILFEQTWNLLAGKHGNVHKNRFKVKGLLFSHLNSVRFMKTDNSLWKAAHLSNIGTGGKDLYVVRFAPDIHVTLFKPEVTWQRLRSLS